jgi:Cytochrome C oxidase, cbb3-type, subunit III
MDYDPPTPAERILARKRLIRWIVIGALILLGIYYLVFVNQYTVAYKDDTEHFKHGSIGSEVANGIPYWVFRALPVIYKEDLGPSGYRKFGLLYDPPDADLPLGFSRRIVDGVERVWLNCSVCHIGTYRLSATDPTKYIYGAPSNNLRLQELIKFLLKVGADPGFNADTLIAAINSPEVGGHLNFFEEAIYRYIIFSRVQSALLDLAQRLSFINRQQDWGPGRVDTFNPYKAIQFGQSLDENHISDEALNGASDYPSIWRQRPREGMNLHWDGNNSSVAERDLSAALGAGVTPTTVDRRAIGRIENWMWDLPAPPFPERSAIDRAAAERGQVIYAEYCAYCHGMRDAGSDLYSYDRNRFHALGQVTPLDDIATDRGRWSSYTLEFAASQNLLYAGYPWRFSHFRKTGGYANQPLDGIWARSPYLHNGSVPTLRDLLEPSGNRPSVWYRGSDLYDLKKVGYRSDLEAGTELFRYDVSSPGNSNKGHEGALYGTELPPSDKDALVEYMKAL